MKFPFLAFAILSKLLSTPIAIAYEPGSRIKPVSERCDQDSLLTITRKFGETVEKLGGMYYHVTSSRHFEVVELVSLYQIRKLFDNVMHFIEAIRITLCYVICPRGCFRGVINLDTELPRFSEILNTFEHNMLYLLNIPQMDTFNSMATQVLYEFTKVARGLSEHLDSYLEFEESIEQDPNIRFDLSRKSPQIFSEFVDHIFMFINPLLEDMEESYRMPNFLSSELIPWFQIKWFPNTSATVFHITDEPNRFNVSAKMILLKPDLLPLLSSTTRHSLLGGLSQAPVNRMYEMCHDVPPVNIRSIVDEDFADISFHVPGAHRSDGSSSHPFHLHRRLASIPQILKALNVRLSNLLISLTYNSRLLHRQCEEGNTWDPVECFSIGSDFAAYYMELSPLTEHKNISVAYVGKTLGPKHLDIDIPLVKEGEGKEQENECIRTTNERSAKKRHQKYRESVLLETVHVVYLEKYEEQSASAVSLVKSMQHHSPDFLFINPLVGNCELAANVRSTGAVKQKILMVPYNPLIPPPLEVIPDFSLWFQLHQGNLEGLWEKDPDPKHGALMSYPELWLAQCSLASVVKKLGKEYELFQVYQGYATLVLRELMTPILRKIERAQESAFSPYAGKYQPCAAKALRNKTLMKWLQGWHCVPETRMGRKTVLQSLEVLFFPHLAAPCDFNESNVCSLLSAAAVPLAKNSPTQCRPASEETPIAKTSMKKTGGEAMPKESEKDDRDSLIASQILLEFPLLRYFMGSRGRCVDGECECFVPYRGIYCSQVDPRRVNTNSARIRRNPYKCAIHYITPEIERDLLDLEYSLDTLWKNYNHAFDHPVIIFHEGLSYAARDRIVLASSNRIWFSSLGRNFASKDSIPRSIRAQMEGEVDNFRVGYLQMIRWRSGPIFHEPILLGFDYGMTLDTDSYFPGPVKVDPFQQMIDRNLTAVFPHLGRDSASVVINFLHYYLLYCKLHNHNPRRSKILAALVEKNWKWYQQCFMLDIEILRLEWFRNNPYQDFFRYMDATGGFYLHRWGNNPFRTFAIGTLLEDDDVSQTPVPYAHQEFCTCGKRHQCVKKEGDSNLFTCKLKEGEKKTEIGSDDDTEEEEDMDIGLLNLKPFHGDVGEESLDGLLRSRDER